ncbi:MAG TPA: response regulator [Terracidiphilus sp.]|jgi:FixJ family two-component response regulator|nr:response regulator [Terracidiphilus sp.]
MNKAGPPSEELVYIVDDDEAICAGLCDLLESAGLKTRAFGSAEEFLEACGPGMKGCLVLDVRLPGMSGMQLQSKLADSGIGLPIIIMTAHGDVPMVKQALKSGAVDFLTKPFQDDELLQAVEQAFRIDRTTRQSDSLVSSIAARVETLTEREQRVLELVTAGLTNREVAVKMFLSLPTVKLYRGQVMRKMHADSLADLVKMAEKLKEPGSSEPHSR